MKRALRVRRRAILDRCRRLLEQCTPLDTDCGALCEGACCKGEGAMWLFPGEDEAYPETLEALGLTVTDGEGNENIPYLRCTMETCRRELRPLSCRIFPYFPMAVRDTKTGRLHVKAVMDPRAMRVCPLLKQDAPPITPRFQHTVERVGRLMLQEPSLREYLLKTSAYLLEMASLL